MSAQNAKPDVLPKEAFSGSLQIDQKTFPLTLTASAGPDGRLVIDPVVVPPELYLALGKAWGKPGLAEQHFSVDAASATGKTLTSDSVVLRGFKSGDGGFEVQLAMAKARLRVPLDKPAPYPGLIRWLRGFQCFAGPQAKTPLGPVTAFGEAKKVDHDELSGGVRIVASGIAPSATWRDEAGAFLLHMQEGLGLAHGGGLRCPLEFYFEGDMQEVTFWRSSGAVPELPVQPHLGLQPFVQALADRYFGKGPLPDILWTALGWSHAETTIDDLRFLTGMIAIEAIAKANLPTPAKGSKKPSFAKRILALFPHFGIAAVDFDPAAVEHMTALRNEIVHDGEAKSTQDLWDNIILVRELVTRILLNEIAYAGPYWCYIGGQHWRQFPACLP